MTQSYNTPHSCFIVKNNSVADTILDSTRVPGALNSYAWKINSKKRCLPGETVSFHNSWGEDSHTQGVILDTFPIADRKVIVFKPNNNVFKKEFLNTEVSGITRAQEKAFISVEQLNEAEQRINLKNFIRKLDKEDLDYSIGTWEDMSWFEDMNEGASLFKYPAVPGSFRILGSSEIDLICQLGVRRLINGLSRGVKKLGEVLILKSSNNNHTQIGDNGFYISKGSNYDAALKGTTVLVVPSVRALENNPNLPWVQFVLAKDAYYIPTRHIERDSKLETISIS